MATTKDELWSLEQRSRGLTEFLSELRILWNDSAAHEISTRYLVPRSDDDQRMQRALADQQNALEELQSHVATVMELASAAEKLSRDIAQLLREILQEVSTANGYYQSFSEFNNTALNLFPQIQELVSNANSACIGIADQSEYDPTQAGRNNEQRVNTSISPQITDSDKLTNPKVNLKHIFHGEINKKGKAVGFHHEGSIGHEGKALVIEGSRSSVNRQGVYYAKVKIYDSGEDKWIEKKNYSTFFPRDWSRQKVLDEINGAFASRFTSDNLRYWEGVSPSGLRIAGYLNSDGTIRTAFPLDPRVK